MTAKTFKPDLRTAAAVFGLLLALVPSLSQAEERGHGGRPPHWEFDGRFHHDRYYPARGYVVAGLPPGSVSIAYGRERFFFQAGVWFRPVGVRFVVVDPPIGIVVPQMPMGCAMVAVGPQNYCYANGVYYLPGSGGYVVSAPPPPATNGSTLPVPVPALPGVAPSTPALLSDLIFYPRDGQDSARTESDRQDCGRWAAAQPNYLDSVVFKRAMSACMEGRGYTVR